MLAPTFHPHRRTRVAMGREKKGSQAGVFSFEGYMPCGESVKSCRKLSLKLACVIHISSFLLSKNKEVKEAIPDLPKS